MSAEPWGYDPFEDLDLELDAIQLYANDPARADFMFWLVNEQPQAVQDRIADLLATMKRYVPVTQAHLDMLRASMEVRK